MAENPRRKRIGKLDTLGSVLLEHSKVYKELRNGRIEPILAYRLSGMLVNHRTILEAQVIESQLVETRKELEKLRADPPILLNHMPLSPTKN